MFFFIPELSCTACKLNLHRNNTMVPYASFGLYHASKVKLESLHCASYTEYVFTKFVAISDMEGMRKKCS